MTRYLFTIIDAVGVFYRIIRSVGNPKICVALVACVLSSSTAKEFGWWQGRMEEKNRRPTVATYKTPVMTGRQADHLAGFGIRWIEKLEEIKRVNSEADRQAVLATRPN